MSVPVAPSPTGSDPTLLSRDGYLLFAGSQVWWPHLTMHDTPRPRWIVNGPSTVYRQNSDENARRCFAERGNCQRWCDTENAKP